jgi:hypothetical protein
MNVLTANTLKDYLQVCIRICNNIIIIITYIKKEGAASRLDLFIFADISQAIK